MSGDLRLVRPARLVRAVLGASAVLVLLTLALAEAGDRGLLFLVREPATAVAGGDGTCSGAECSYAGLLSQVGVLALWGAAACAATCAVLTRERLLAWLAAATAGVAVDDAFLLHDGLFVVLAPEAVVVAVYAAAATGMALHLRRGLARTSWPLLALATALLAGSALVDLTLPGVNLLEDGALKLPGVLLWSAYVAGTSLLAARRVGA